MTESGPDSKSLSVCSYNCRDWISGKDYIAQLLSHQICLIQEHWLLSDSLNSLSTLPNTLSMGVSGMNHNEVLFGRPYGGCGIIYHKSIVPFIKHVDCSSYTRFCAVSCHFNSTLLLVCVYFPTNYHNSDSDASFIETLSELDALLMSVLMTMLLLLKILMLILVTITVVSFLSLNL